MLIASHNRRDWLRRCLDSLSAQTAPQESFEAIVIDDGSDDGTSEMVEELETPFPLRLLRLEGVGKYTAVNTAVEVAAAPACLILDDDVIASPELIAAYIAAHDEEPLTLGVGALTQQPPASRDWYARAFARGWNEHYDDFERRPAAWSDCYGANFSAPRSILREIGGFDTSLKIAGDLEIGLRLVQAGAIPRYLADAHGIHDDQKRSRKMFSDASRQGAAHIELARLHPDAADEFLDWERGAGPKELRLRRLLIALRVPPRLLAAPGALLPGEGRKMVWFHVVRRFAFWRSVRLEVDRATWRQLTSGSGPPRAAAAVAQRTS